LQRGDDDRGDDQRRRQAQERVGHVMSPKFRERESAAAAASHVNADSSNGAGPELRVGAELAPPPPFALAGAFGARHHVSQGEGRGGGDMGSVCRRFLALGASAAVVLLVSVGRAAPLPRPEPDLSDAQEARDDALLATPNFVTPAPLSNIFATAPNLEAQAPAPQFRANAVLPPGWSSNGEKSGQGAIASGQWRPVGRLSWSAPVGALPLRVTVTGFAQSDRFFRSSNADIDKAGGSARLQIVDAGDDQAFSPYLLVAPRWDFDPGFGRQISARQDLSVGLNKRANFDGAFHRIAAAGNTSGETVWSAGVTVFAQRRLREPQASSYAIFVIPSVSYASGRDWSASFGVEFLSRWNDPTSSGATRVKELEPIATVEYVVPAAFFGGDGNAALFGHPAFDLQGSYLKVWSSRAGGGYEQWQAVAALKMGWKF